MSGLNILYRGPLSSCNYDCDYCPFAKHRESVAELDVDRACLDRFVDWVASENGAHLGPISLLFTPWGEALTRRWYRDGITTLSDVPHVSKVAIQTNLSISPQWVLRGDASRIALWCTFHPTQVSLDRFVERVEVARKLGVNLSVGIVGFDAHLELARELRRRLDDGIYLWVNLAHEQQRYTEADLAEWRAIDPLVDSNMAVASQGSRCFTGFDTISVDGAGKVTRCHFVDHPLGNLYDGTLHLSATPSPCPNASCHCHIGLVHLESTGLRDRFGTGLLERVPVRRPSRAERTVDPVRSV